MIKVNDPRLRRAYLSGPMSGIPEFNFPAFMSAADALDELGFEVFNPASKGWGDGDPTVGRTEEEEYQRFLRNDVTAVAAADCVFVLPGWEKSRGATFEVSIARKLGIPVYDYETGDIVEPPAETVCQEADRLVSTDRQTDYGHPLDDFSRTAKMITGVLLDLLRPDVEVQAEHVPLIMECVKISREINHPKRDNRVDGCGYWKTLDLVIDERERRAASPIPAA